MPPGAVGHLDRQFVIPAVDRRLEPVFVDQAMRHPQHGERFHRIGPPVGGLRIAEHGLVEIDCRPGGADVAVAAAGVVVVDLPHVEQPERPCPHKGHRPGQNRISVGDLAALIPGGGLQEHSPCANPTEGHGLVGDRPAGLLQQRHRGLRLTQDELILGGRIQERHIQLPAAIDLGPRQCRQQRREDALAVGQQVIQSTKAKGLFHHAQVGQVVHVGEVIRGIGGLFEMGRGAGKIAARHRQPAKLQMGHGGQRMLELARGQRGLLQNGDRRRRSPSGRQGQAEFEIDPRLRPVVGLSGAALQGGDEVVDHRIVGGQRAEQFAAAADGQGRAADDLRRLDGKQVGRLHDPALLERCRDGLPLSQEHVGRQLTQRGLQRANLPGGRLLDGGIGRIG